MATVVEPKSREKNIEINCTEFSFFFPIFNNFQNCMEKVKNLKIVSLFTLYRYSILFHTFRPTIIILDLSVHFQS